MTTFSQLLASAVREADTWKLDVPEDWMQGRTAFGGLQVAFALHAMRWLLPSVPLRTLQTTFLAPVAGCMRARARVLRQGKNVALVEARLGDDAAPQAIVIGAFGVARSSVVERDVERPQIAFSRDHHAGPSFDEPRDGAPGFARHFEVRRLLGRPPFSGDTTHHHVLDVRFEDGDRTTEAQLIAIADFIPPIGMSFLQTPAPGSTLTWMLELLVEDLSAVRPGAFRVHAELVAARNGYTSQAVTVFAPDGTALALSHQHMLVFA
jgi:acyl-coenzyme A thioesterase PaaI-like protein